MTPARFSSIVASPSLALGLTSQTFTITSAVCPYTPVNKDTTNTSFFNINYPTTSLTSSACPSPTNIPSNSSRTCRYPSAPMPITAITHSISESTTTPIVISLQTYFAALNAYFPLCEQTYPIPLVPQPLPASAVVFSTALCSSARTWESNPNTVLVIRADGVAINDVLRVEGLLGTVTDTNWQKLGTAHQYTLRGTNILNSTHISVPMPYSNPTSITPNTLTNLTLSRTLSSTSVLYAYLAGTGIPLCPVTSPTALASLDLALSSPATYQSSVVYSFSLGNRIRDYSGADYVRVQFVGYEGVMFLMGPGVALAASLVVNGQSSSCSVQVINHTLVHVFNISRLNQNSGTASLLLTGMTNPATIYPITPSPGYSILVSLFSSLLLSPK